MRITRSNRLRFLSILVLGVGAFAIQASARRAPAPPATGTFNHIEFENTTGRVGYHMYSTVRVFSYDTPTGDAVVCAPAAADTTTSGTIPAGLVLLANDVNGQGLHGFDGTPRQPGDWTVYVTIGRIQCQGGPDRNIYGPRTVAVHFHVDP